MMPLLHLWDMVLAYVLSLTCWNTRGCSSQHDFWLLSLSPVAEGITVYQFLQLDCLGTHFYNWTSGYPFLQLDVWVPVSITGCLGTHFYSWTRDLATDLRVKDKRRMSHLNASELRPKRFRIGLTSFADSHVRAAQTDTSGTAD